MDAVPHQSIRQSKWITKDHSLPLQGAPTYSCCVYDRLRPSPEHRRFNRAANPPAADEAEADQRRRDQPQAAGLGDRGGDEIDRHITVAAVGGVVRAARDQHGSRGVFAALEPPPPPPA